MDMIMVDITGGHDLKEGDEVDEEEVAQGAGRLDAAVALQRRVGRAPVGPEPEQEEEDERDARARGLERHAEALIEPRRGGEVREEREEAGGGERRQRDPLRDVAQAEVPELVREDRLDLLGREALEQRVEEDDALGAPEAREVRIPVATPSTTVHNE